MILFRLVCVEGPDEGKEFGISEEGATIGRAPEAGVILSDDSVSRLHAAVHITDEGVELVDLGSRNGTRVNGESVSCALLRIRDMIQLGEVRLVVKEHETQPAGGQTRSIPEGTVAAPHETDKMEPPLPSPSTDIFLRGSAALRVLAEEAARVDREYGRSGVVMRAGVVKVTCMDGPDRGKLCTPGNRHAILGTDPAADICLRTPGAAFHHAELIPAARKKLLLKDLGSKQGTFVDGKRIQETELTVGSIFQIGRSRFVVHI